MPTSATDKANSRTPSRKRRRVVTALAVLVLVVIIGAIAARDAAHWLVRPDPLAHADVIVVLSGGLPFRAEGTADVYQQGYAPLVWVTKPDGPQEELAELGVTYIGEEEYNRQAIVHRGAPEAVVQIL